MANRGKIPCETPGCGETKARGYLLCTSCWRCVPDKLQREVFRTFRAWDAERTRDRVNIAALRTAGAAYRTAAAAATNAACESRFPGLFEARQQAQKEA